MIAFEKYRFLHTPPRQQKLDGLPGSRATVDVVTEKNRHRPRNRTTRGVRLDLRQQRCEKVGPAVHVADGIYPNTFRHPWGPPAASQRG